MDPKIQAIFEPLRVAIEAQPYTAADLMVLLGNFIEIHPVVGKAACYHASDIFQEPQAGDTFAWIIAEVYRRTFFDVNYATIYGTTKLLDAGEEAMKGMVEHVLACLVTDEIITRAMVASPPQNSAGNH